LRYKRLHPAFAAKPSQFILRRDRKVDSVDEDADVRLEFSTMEPAKRRATIRRFENA
jgi:hypothetical protein